MSLTIEQQEAHDEIINLIVNKKYPKVILDGPAGVGKTYLVNRIIRNFRNQTYTFDRKGNRQVELVYVTAPTNKALSVVRGKVNPGSNISFSTTHSGLKLRRKWDNDTGEVYFAQEYHQDWPPFKNAKLIIIDEASMINKLLLKYLMKVECPVIFIGDRNQIPPVGEVISPIYEMNWPTVRLTKIVRQAEGNPIINLSRNLNLINLKQNNVTEDMIGYVHTLKRPKIIEELSEVNGTDEMKYLAYTNTEVDVINSSVRNRIYGSPAMLEQGETIVLNAPYEDKYYTNQEVKIHDLDITTQNHYGKELKIYKINDEMNVVHESSIRDFKDIKIEIKNRCKNKLSDWKEYYGFLESFAEFKYNHALTVHKSQGSTFKNTILNVGNIRLNRKKHEVTKLLYTGVTRASDLLILYNVR